MGSTRLKGTGKGSRIGQRVRMGSEAGSAQTSCNPGQSSEAWWPFRIVSHFREKVGHFYSGSGHHWICTAPERTAWPQAKQPQRAICRKSRQLRDQALRAGRGNAGAMSCARYRHGMETKRKFLRRFYVKKRQMSFRGSPTSEGSLSYEIKPTFLKLKGCFHPSTFHWFLFPLVFKEGVLSDFMNPYLNMKY